MHTRESVERQLIATFEQLPLAPVLSRSDPLRVDVPGRPDLRRPLRWGRFLADDEFGRRALFTWARCKATRSSFGEQCKELGWSRSSAEDARRRAADAIVRGLDFDDAIRASAAWSRRSTRITSDRTTPEKADRTA